jgi:hypothetical protein
MTQPGVDPTLWSERGSGLLGAYWHCESTPYSASRQDDPATSLLTVIHSSSAYSHSNRIAEFDRFRSPRERVPKRFWRSIRSLPSAIGSAVEYQTMLPSRLSDPSPNTADVPERATRENLILEWQDGVRSFELDAIIDKSAYWVYVNMRSLFSKLRSNDPARRARIRNAVLSCGDPSLVAEAALAEYERTGQSELLLYGRALLEDFGSAAWDALKKIANSGREECELFVGPIVNCPGVEESERVQAVRALASNPNAIVRSCIYEYLGQFTREGTKAVLDILAKDPDSEISDEACRRLSSLSEGL